MSKLTQKNKGNEVASVSNENQNNVNNSLNFEQDSTKAKDLEFFKFEAEGSEFIGKFLEIFDSENKTESNPNGLEGFLFEDLNGQNYLLPNYYKIGQYIDEKMAEGLDFSKTVFKITLKSVTESSKGKLYIFDFKKATI